MVENNRLIGSLKKFDKTTAFRINIHCQVVKTLTSNLPRKGISSMEKKSDQIDLVELKTDVAIIKQRVDIHDSAITRLEFIVGELDEDIQEMNKELGRKIDTLHSDALSSVPEWAAKDLRKNGLSTGALLTVIVILVTAVLALTIHALAL